LNQELNAAREAELSRVLAARRCLEGDVLSSPTNALASPLAAEPAIGRNSWRRTLAFASVGTNRRRCFAMRSCLHRPQVVPQQPPREIKGRIGHLGPTEIGLSGRGSDPAAAKARKPESISNPGRYDLKYSKINNLAGGEGGIRTLGPPQGGQRFSRPPRSTAPAPLRANGRRRLARRLAEHQENIRQVGTQVGPKGKFQLEPTLSRRLLGVPGHAFIARSITSAGVALIF
jgi:hypothetical protein